MKRKILIFFIPFFLLSFSLNALESSLDSFLIVHKDKHDTLKIQLLLEEYFTKYERGLVSDGEECLQGLGIS